MADSCVDTIKGILMNPVPTFQSLREKTLGEALKYFLILVIIYSVLIAIIASIGISAGMFSTLTGSSPVAGGAMVFVTVFVLNLIMMIIFTFIVAIIVHIFVILLGGKQGFHQTMKGIIYGGTPAYLLGWIPFIGIIFSIWGFILEILGIRELQQMSTLRAVLAVIIPIIIVMAVMIVLIAAFFMTVMSASSGAF